MAKVPVFWDFFSGETEKTEDGWRNDCLGVRTNPGGFTQADASSSFKDKDTKTKTKTKTNISDSLN